MILEAFQHDQYDEDENANYIPIKIALQIEDVSISDALPHPITVMAESLATEPADIAMHDCMVHYRSAY